MKNFRLSSLNRGHAALIVVLSLAFLGLLSISRSSAKQEEEPKAAPTRVRSDQLSRAFDYDAFLEREKNGEFPFQGGDVPVISRYNSLINNNAGATGTGFFTQSEPTIAVFGNTIVVGFVDSGSNAGDTNKFTGFARSTDGGATFADGGTLPTNPGGDGGSPVLTRDNTIGRLYFATIGFSADNIQVFRSDDDGATWMPPANGTPGGLIEDREWITVDNFAGPGNGNVYLVSRRFGAGPGIYFFRSTDHGETFGPNSGTLIVTDSQGAFVSVAPDHSVYVFWWAGWSLQMRKSTDQGLTFGAPVTVAYGLVGGVNGDLGLTGIPQGTKTALDFHSNQFPHAAVNPVNGDIYITYSNYRGGADKADVFLVQSTDGGATWGAPVRINDDATTTDQWHPTLAVTPDGSNLGIFYYSRQEDPVWNNLYKFYGRVARISGSTLTFMPSFAVSDVSSLPEFGRDDGVNSTFMSGHNIAVGTSGAFHVVWSDNRADLLDGEGRKDPNLFYKRIDLTIHVTTTVPAATSVISTQPTAFTMDISEPADPASLQAGDFTVNGIPASSFVYIPGSTTIVFTFDASPVTAGGLQIMSIAAGAFASASAGDPVPAFTGTFRYDTLLLQVVATVPTVDGVFTLPSPFTYDVIFNELIDPASVQLDDLQLSGIAGSAVTAASVLPGNTTVRFTINIPSEGTITARIPARAISDAFGNVGAAFTGVYLVENGTTPFPMLRLTQNPQGSLIYNSSTAGNIGLAGDTDNFTLTIDPNQTVTVIITGSGGLQPSVELRKPDSTVIGSATGAADNQLALLQTAPAPTGGTYTFTVSGAGGTTGDYTLQVILNAAKELEGTIPDATNNTLATAQNIDSSFIKLRTSLASAKRGAVNGTTGSENYSASAVAHAFEDISETGTLIRALQGVNGGSEPIPIGFTFPFYGVVQPTVFVSANGLLTFGNANSSSVNSDLTDSLSQAAIAVFWDDLHTNGGQLDSQVFFQVSGSGPDQHLTIQWNQIRFNGLGFAGDTITFQAQLFADGRIQLNYQDLVSGTAAGNNGATATVGIRGAGTQRPDRLLLAFNNGPNDFVGSGKSTLIFPNPTPDLLSFTLTAGEANTLVVKSLSGLPANVALLDCDGEVIATGVSGALNVDSVIGNFVAPVSGVYYARITSFESVPYNLVVTRNAAFDTERNDRAATAQPLDISRGALGSIISGSAYQAAAVAYDFEDISGTGTVITELRNADGASLPIPIGFTFPFYGVGQTIVFVSDKGLLTFGAANPSLINFDLTIVPAEAAIAVLWDDLFVSSRPGANVFYQVSGSGPDQHLTIQWNQIGYFNFDDNSGMDTITFQAQLFADGRIQLNYQDLIMGGITAGNSGRRATVGIKGAGAQGPDRLLLAFNNGPNDFVGSARSTLIIQQPPVDWYSITVSDGRLKLVTSTPADGPGEFVNALDPHIELYDSTGTTLIATGAPLDDGRNESINVSGLPAPATYLVRVTSERDTSGEYILGTGTPPPSSDFSHPSTKISTGQVLRYRSISASVSTWDSTSSLRVRWFHAESTARRMLALSRAWAGSCRELDVMIRDSMHIRTKVRFK
jgi:hypothetical protein